MKTDKFKTNPVAKKIKEENKKVYVEIDGTVFKTDPDNVAQYLGAGWNIKDKTKIMPVAKKKTTKRAVGKTPSDIFLKTDHKTYVGELNKLNQPGIDNDPGIDVPLHARGGTWKWNFEEQETFDKGTVVGYESAASDFKRVNRITWVLTGVNVAILISLVINNIN